MDSDRPVYPAATSFRNHPIKEHRYSPAQHRIPILLRIDKAGGLLSCMQLQNRSDQARSFRFSSSNPIPFLTGKPEWIRWNGTFSSVCAEIWVSDLLRGRRKRSIFFQIYISRYERIFIAISIDVYTLDVEQTSVNM